MTKFDFRALREKLGISAHTLGKLLGSNGCSIYNFEKGRSNPRDEVVIKRAIKLRTVVMCLINDPDYLIKLFDKLKKSVDNQ